MSDFDDEISLAHQSDAQVADFLEHLGDAEGARELREPGTRMASPKVVKITSGLSAMATQSSTRPIGSTQTGQPGPWISSMQSGSIPSRP